MSCVVPLSEDSSGVVWINVYAEFINFFDLPLISTSVKTMKSKDEELLDT